MRLGPFVVALALLFFALPPPPSLPPPGHSGLFAPGPELVPKAGAPAAALGFLAVALAAARAAGAARPTRGRPRRPPLLPERRRYLVLGRLLLEGG